LSQPICTFLQIAIVDLLSSWKISASTVVGHSSGEIAAAYASGAISRESAWQLAYFRGLAVAIGRDIMDSDGSMVAVLATPERMEPLLEIHNVAHPQDEAVIACYNSSSNLTISGSCDAIDRLETILTNANITFRRFKTGVAYHSHHMEPVAKIYRRLIRPMRSGEQSKDRPLFMSTVTGNFIEEDSELNTSQYWLRNLVAPVQFSKALGPLCADRAKRSTAATAADIFIEIGPHSALRSPLKDILKANGRDIESDYTSVLVRNRNAIITALECVGKLFASGASIDLAEVNQSQTCSDAKLLTTLPQYPFNDKTKYWLEGRSSAQYRFRNHVHNEFLGLRVDDWNECEARWTNRIILDQSPWLKDHQVNGSIIFPAAGFMVMTLEAARQLYGVQTSVTGYRLKDVKFPKAVTISQAPKGTELQITLCTGNKPAGSTDSSRIWNEFFIFVYENDGWVECCSGALAVDFKEDATQIFEVDERVEYHGARVRSITTAMDDCHTNISSSDVYEAFSRAGLSYGPFFQSLQDIRWDGNSQATGAVNLEQWRLLNDVPVDSHLIHPTALDAILQLTFPAFSIYDKNASATTVPTGFRSAWFPAVATNASGSKAMVHAKVIERGFRNKSFAITAALIDSETPIFIGEMDTSTIGTSNLASEVESKPLYRIEYQPDIDLLPHRLLHLEPDLTRKPSVYQDKELLCLASIHNALEQILTFENLPSHIQEHVKWMKLQASKHNAPSLESVESMCQRLEYIDVEARLLVRVARNLPSILAGETDPLTLLFADDILSDFYANFHSNRQLLSRAAKEIRVLAHKYPAMKVLEIGAGTGSATAHILDALEGRVAEYVYTDVTPSFFVKARERFTSPKMTFKTLDISRDPVPQGFAERGFDLIVAANVSHILASSCDVANKHRYYTRPTGSEMRSPNVEHFCDPGDALSFSK
jgi:acyl transferase domain-containing protein